VAVAIVMDRISVIGKDSWKQTLAGAAIRGYHWPHAASREREKMKQDRGWGRLTRRIPIGVIGVSTKRVLARRDRKWKGRESE
jgi:hypothetical protein